MSTEYKYPIQVPTQKLADRLLRLAQAVSEGDYAEFTMRVPADATLDADMVLQEASRRLDATLTAFDLNEHIHRQREFSERTFGPGKRLAGVIDHIRKELVEVEQAAAAGEPTLPEWVDVILLALDGAWRTGATPLEISAAIAAKQARNEARKWPDWRSADPGKAIEHDRTQP